MKGRLLESAEHLEGERLVWRDCAVKFEALIVRLAEARRAIRNAQNKPAYLAAATDEWEVLQEIDGFVGQWQQSTAVPHG